MFTLSGCRSANGVQVDVMERELRQQENYIYELEDYLVEYSDKLRECRCAHQSTAVGNNTVRKKSSSTSVPTLAEDDLSDDDLDFSDESENTDNSIVSEKPGSEDSSDSDLPEPATEADPTQIMPNPTDETPIEDLKVPELEIEAPSAFRQDVSPPTASTTAAEVIPVSKKPLDIPDPVNFESESNHFSQAAAVQNAILEDEAQDIIMADGEQEYYEPTDGSEVNDARDPRTIDIDRIVIQHLFRGVLEEQSNDEARSKREAQKELSFEEALFAEQPTENALPSSLLAVVEVRDQLNEPVEANGPVSLMVMAIGSDNKARRIQRWDFSEEEVNASWQSSPYGDGLHLELPLDIHSSSSEQLELWARLVSTNGEKYLTKLPFKPHELMVFGDEPIPTTETFETRIAARSRRDADQSKQESDLIDSPNQQSVTPTPQWRASTDTASGSSYSASNTRLGTNRSVRWSAQSSGKRLRRSSSIVATAQAPERQSGYAKPNAQATGTNEKSAWKTVPPSR